MYKTRAHNWQSYGVHSYKPLCLSDFLQCWWNDGGQEITCEQITFILI